MSTPLSKRKTPTKPLHMPRPIHAKLKALAQARGITMVQLLQNEVNAAMPKESKP